MRREGMDKARNLLFGMVSLIITDSMEKMNILMTS